MIFNDNFTNIKVLIDFNLSYICTDGGHNYPDTLFYQNYADHYTLMWYKKDIILYL